VAQAEAKLRQLKEQQRALIVAAGKSQAQQAVMQGLVKVMQAKLEAAARGAGGSAGGGGAAGGTGRGAAHFNTATANVAVF